MLVQSVFASSEAERLMRVHRGSRTLLEPARFGTEFVCRVAPRLITKPEEYREARRSGTSHHKVSAGKKCEVGEPVDSVQPTLRRIKS